MKFRRLAYLFACGTLLLSGGFTVQSNNAFAAETATQESGVNHAPTATAASETMMEDTTLEGRVTGTDPDGDPLTFALARGPAHGSVEINPDGTYTYKPAPDYSGSDNFYFKADDGTTKSTAATVTITITNVNDTPWINPKSYTTLEDLSIIAKLIGFDKDAGDPLTYSIPAAPVNGALSINSSTGEFVYTPNPGYSGTDSFIVIVYDGESYSAPATITITVTPLNDAPAAKPAEAEVNQETVLSSVLNGTDPDGDDLTFIQISAPTHGTLFINASTGAFTYTPEAGYIGMDSFAFAVSDGTSTSAPATVTIKVNPANHAPTAIAASGVTKKGKALRGTLSGTDEDAGTTLSFAIATQPEHGKVKLDAASGAYKYKPSAGFTGTDSFTFTVSDGTLTSAPAVVSITVEPKNTKVHGKEGNNK
ncbi:Ig-like domain-containing protein [Paenibacillus sp. BK720]|uniref:Ig-like domain-containing protein n=1 Tax=Paenibacillus sp. BK720 TaxID=2587092 RepID=UPI0014218A21|nr:Ig-like domain-containing protein [Paenibacillus sp. BK720]NIK70082.1 VCBS repeat-containing protein [Paenibacillus sp. BK720]